MDSLRKEISIARSLGHRNIVKYFTCDLSEENGKDAPMGLLLKNAKEFLKLFFS